MNLGVANVTRTGLNWCVCASEQQFARVASKLRDMQSVACVSIVPAVRSLSVWNGGRVAARKAAATTHLAERHPCDKAGLLGWRADAPPSVTLTRLGGPRVAQDLSG